MAASEYSIEKISVRELAGIASDHHFWVVRRGEDEDSIAVCGKAENAELVAAALNSHDDLCRCAEELIACSPGGRAKVAAEILAKARGERADRRTGLTELVYGLSPGKASPAAP